MTELLRLEALNTAYGQSHVLHNINLSVDEGESVALLGRNGAGKTTVMRSISGIQKPFDGLIYYRGEDITDEKTYQIASRGIGYVPEDRRIFDKLTVEEHIILSYNKDVRSLDKEFERIFDIFPELEKLTTSEAENLSGGEQQMLAIARALVGDKDLILLDEPTEGLAPQIIENITRTIKQMSNDITILLVEQNYQVARDICEKYYILDQGEIVSKGSMESLDGKKQLKQRYLGVSG